MEVKSLRDADLGRNVARGMKSCDTYAIIHTHVATSDEICPECKILGYLTLRFVTPAYPKASESFPTTERAASDRLRDSRDVETTRTSRPKKDEVPRLGCIHVFDLGVSCRDNRLPGSTEHAIEVEGSYFSGIRNVSWR